MQNSRPLDEVFRAGKHRNMQFWTMNKNPLQYFSLVSFSTWAEWLQSPGFTLVLFVHAPQTSPASLHVHFLIVRPWGFRAVIQEAISGHDLGEALLTATHPTLTGTTRKKPSCTVGVIGHSLVFCAAVIWFLL